MNESALNALINLFAIFSVKGNLDYEDGKNHLEDYLKQRLGLRDTAEFISLFYEIHELYSLSPDFLNDEKLQGLINQICSQLKSKIPHSEQVIVFLHFLDLASGDSINVEDQYYRLVSRIFEISPEDYSCFKDFIFAKNPEQLNNEKYLIIDKEKENKNFKGLHLQEVNLEGQILVFYITDIEQFVFKFFGPDVLMLEGIPVREGLFYTLNQGSIIRGRFIAGIYYSDISQKYFNYKQKNPIIFSAKDISYTFPGSTNGIRRFSFSERSGQLIAVMGGSGVGKSTLLNLLNGNIVPSTGKITINGFNIHNDYDEIEGVIGYIPQDDLVISELTVFQNVYHNARLCLNQLNDDEIRERVNKLLSDLDLYDIRDMVVGSPLKKVLSGGQRKRLNIALELIREPSLLFVDEPTSGLSSRDSERIMVLLKEQARQGRLVIVNIHQPSSFIYKLFDKLWILDKGGYPVYAGNPIDAVMYFKELANHIDSDSCECSACGNVNPEQVLDIIESNKIDASGKLTEERIFSPEELYQLYTNKIQKNQEAERPDEIEEKLEVNFNKPGRLKQFKIYAQRNLQSKLSNKQYIIINLLQAPLLALVVSMLTRFAGDEGYFFGDNKNFPSFIFMAVVVMLFQGMSISAEEIIRDRALLQRESFLKLSRFSYLNSKIVFLFTLSLIQSFLFTGLSFLILNIDGLFVHFWFILFLTAAFANMAGLVISAGLNSVVTIYISIPLLIIPQILLCGLIVPFEDLKSNKSRHNNVPVIGDLMVSRWAFEALTVNQFINNKHTVHYFDIEKEMAEYYMKANFIINEVSDLAQSVRFDVETSGVDKDISSRLRILKKETSKLDSDSLTKSFPLELLSESRFNEAVYDSLQHHLDSLKDIYKKLYTSAENYKEKITGDLISQIGNDELYNLQRTQKNSALETLLRRDKSRSDMVVQGERRIIVKMFPIYRNPESGLGRAHFYAPFKALGNLRIPTLTFNSVAIMLMTYMLYIALYYNWLGRILSGWGVLRRKIRI